MQYVEFRPIGRRVSRIGLGCGRLAGRSDLRASAKLVEAALDLGISYFDVAPSYGLGTAEEVLGAVIGSSKDVAIGTKVGVPRPPYSAKAIWARRLTKPFLDRARALKTIARSLAERSSATLEERPRYDFSPGAIRASLEVSLRTLRRDSVDVFLAHEPHPEDLSEEVAAGFQRLRDDGLITAFGVGVVEASDRWQRFGSIWQSGWPGPPAQRYAQDVEHIWHGAVRNSQRAERGTKPPRPSAVVRRVLEDSPNSILLVSASTPQRLRELLVEVDGAPR
jgi:aryl-alcohol dehydrogenase-like predicted oxidoreductase